MGLRIWRRDRSAGEPLRADPDPTGTTTFRFGLTGLASTAVGGASSAPGYSRDPQGSLIGLDTDNDSTVYYAYDGQGNVVALVNASGSVTAQHRYEPYGSSLTDTGFTTVPANSYGYKGEWKEANGLYRMGLRYYNPTDGRWTQQDISRAWATQTKPLGTPGSRMTPSTWLIQPVSQRTARMDRALLAREVCPCQGPAGGDLEEVSLTAAGPTGAASQVSAAQSVESSCGPSTPQSPWGLSWATRPSLAPVATARIRAADGPSKFSYPGCLPHAAVGIGTADHVSRWRAERLCRATGGFSTAVGVAWLWTFWRQRRTRKKS